MAQATGVIAVSERLRKLAGEATRQGAYARAADIGLACFYLGQFAALLSLEPANQETDPRRRHDGERKASALWCSHAE
jgi:hypothetical protein